MEGNPTPVYPPGKQPYDRANAVRIGALVGAVIGVVITALAGFANVWLVALLALLGGAAGYAFAKLD